MPNITLDQVAKDTHVLTVCPMVEWQDRYAQLSEAQRWAVRERAAALAERLSRLEAYISRRMSGGKHDDAVKAQNKAARGVRQALGYTYADDAILF